MAQIDIRREYADGEILLASDLDAILDDVEAFLNVTKINDDNIQDGGITASSKLADATISTAKLANSSVTTNKINDLAVTAAKLAADAVETAKIKDDAVTNAKLADDAVDTLQIKDNAVTNAKMANDAIDTAEIKDGAVTPAKRSATTASAISSSSGAFSTSNSSYTDVTNLSVNVTTNGRPVVVQIIPDGSTSPAQLTGTVRVIRDSTPIGVLPTSGSSATFYDAPAAGTYTYKVQAKDDDPGVGVTNVVYYCKLFVYEL